LGIGTPSGPLEPGGPGGRSVPSDASELVGGIAVAVVPFAALAWLLVFDEFDPQPAVASAPATTRLQPARLITLEWPTKSNYPSRHAAAASWLFSRWLESVVAVFGNECERCSDSNGVRIRTVFASSGTR
jgi:hypothetical protein